MNARELFSLAFSIEDEFERRMRAAIELGEVLRVINRRHSEERHAEISRYIGSMSFVRDCEATFEDTHEMRRVYRFQLRMAEQRGLIIEKGTGGRPRKDAGGRS
jgi:hypothetical protein